MSASAAMLVGKGERKGWRLCKDAEGSTVKLKQRKSCQTTLMKLETAVTSLTTEQV